MTAQLTPRLYECRVIGVNPERGSMDVLSRDGARFSDVRYLVPWQMPLGESGYSMAPRVNDMCLVASSLANGAANGRAAFCLGFYGRIPANPTQDSGSQGLFVTSDMGDKAQVSVSRGGTVVSGVNTAKDVYSPIDDSIVRTFNKFFERSPGSNTDYSRGGEDINYKRDLYTKTKKNGLHVHVEFNPKVGLSVVADKDGNDLLSLSLGDDGVVKIKAQALEIKAESSLSLDGGQVKIKGRQVLAQGDPI